MRNLGILIFTLVLLSTCNKDTTSVSAPKPALKNYSIGEKWTWQWKSTVEGEVRAQGTDIQEIVDYDGALGLWNGFDTLQLSKMISKEPSITPFRDWPLTVGKKWKYEAEWTNESGEKGKTSQDAEIISYKELKVAAGKFMAYQIKYEGLIENYSAGGKGEVRDIFWYSPELKMNIKHVQEGGGGFIYTSELSAYSKPQ